MEESDQFPAPTVREKRLYNHFPLCLRGVMLRQAQGQLYLSTYWMGPRAGMDIVEKRNILFLPGIEPQPSSS
jgi:hypothetical protein